MSNIWNDIEVATTHLQKIAKNGKVPKYCQMRKEYGRSFRLGIKSLGGYRNVVSQADLEISKYHKASDGHILSSYYEYLFDEYLFLNNIPHDIDSQICSESKCRYDFKIKDVYVEIWGISATGNFYNNYCERRKKKEKIYEKLELQLLSFEGRDFRLDSNELQSLFKDRLQKFDIHSRDQQQDYPVFNRRKLDYWNETTVLKEIKTIAKKIGDFPTAHQLRAKHRSDLISAIQKFGGFRKFANLLGYQSKTKEYSEDRIINELKLITKNSGHFPNDRELQESNHSDLASSIKTHSGYGYFQKIVTGERTKRPYGYWGKEENIIAELKDLTNTLGRFPKYAELGQIAKGIDKSNKGMKYFEEAIL